MAERGFDLADHTSKSLFDYFMQSHIGYLITVCSRAEALCPIMPFVGTRIFWDLEDPAAFEGTEEERLAKFREMRDLTEAKVLEFIASV